MLNALLGWALSFSVLSAAVFWLNFQWQNDRYLVLINQRQNDARALMASMVHDLKRSNFQATMSNKQLGNMGLCPSAFAVYPKTLKLADNKYFLVWTETPTALKITMNAAGFD